MGALIVNELRKAFSNRWLFAALIVGTGLALVSGVSRVVYMLNQQAFLSAYPDAYWCTSAMSCLRSWITVDFLSSATGTFWLIVPLLATLAYAWSYDTEHRSGYEVSLITRTTRGRYFGAKCIATFVSGGCVVAIPMLLNLVLVACFLPVYTPDVFDLIYHGVYSDDLMSNLYYTRPVLYASLRIALDVVLVGLWCVSVLCYSTFVRRRTTFLVFPYLFLIYLKLWAPYLMRLFGTECMAVSLLDQLAAHSELYTYTGRLLAVECLLMLAFITLTLVRNRERDVL